MHHDVFISYSSRDKATADAVCHAIEAAGIRCWIAPRDIQVGLSWKQSVVEAIREARMMVLIFSGEANNSPQVQREVDIAFESGNPILPFRIEDVEMNEDLYYCVAARHWLDALTDPKDEHIQELVVSVRALVGADPTAPSSAEMKESAPLPAPTPVVEPTPAEPPAGGGVFSEPTIPTGQVEAPARPATGETKRLAKRLGTRAARRMAIGAVAIVVVLVGRALLSGPSAEELTRAGVAAYDTEDYSAALPLLIKATEKEDPEAQYTLGRMYLNGFGVTEDADRAHELFRASAAQDHPGGQSGLGYLYSIGGVVEQDDEEAVRWLEMSASQGFAYGQWLLGYMYRSGRGVDQSDEEAVRWYRAAAEQGDPRAQFYLGYMYQYGLGVETDAEEAARLYGQAAEQGSASGQVNLGYLYGRGEGVPRNYGEQVRWYGLAARQGDTTARNNLEILQNRPWPGTPLMMPDAWTVLEDDERSAELDRFRGDTLSARLAGWDFERVRTLAVNFYDDAALYEVELWKEEERGLFTYLRAERGLTAIDGKSPQIHVLNREAPLRTESIRQAVWYLRFFVGALAGDGGRFQVVEEVDDLLWIDPGANREERAAVAGKLRLLSLSENPAGGWLGSGTVVFRQGVYDAEFEVPENGIVKMLNDTRVAADLPIFVESFDENGVRTRAAPDGGDEP